MKKNLLLLLIAILCACTLVVFCACDNVKEQPHEHAFSADWSSDEQFHWHICTGEACTEISEKANHTWNDGEITTPATETADGVKTYTCTVCNATKTESIDKLTHTHTFDETTWTSNNEGHWHAATCEHTTETIAFAEHTWDDGEITTPATETADGVKTYTCTVCNATKTEPVAYNGVTTEQWAAMIDKSNFANYTIKNEYTYQIDGDEVTTEVIFKTTIDKISNIYADGYIDTQQGYIAEETTTASYNMILGWLNNFNDFDFDATTKTYIANRTLTHTATIFNTTYDYKLYDAIITLSSDNKLQKIEGKQTSIANGDETTAETIKITYSFYDYNTTVIESNAVTAEQWNAAMEKVDFNNCTVEIENRYEDDCTYKITDGAISSTWGTSDNTLIEEIQKIIAILSVRIANYKNFQYYEDYDYYYYREENPVDGYIDSDITISDGRITIESFFTDLHYYTFIFEIAE